MVSNELLKQKILDEAIHGRLVKNDLSLEPIDVEEVSENVPFEIPSNWRWTKLGKCTEFNVGKTPSTKESTYWKEEIDWISISDMIHRRKIISTKKMISKKALKEVFKTMCFPKRVTLCEAIAETAKFIISVFAKLINNINIPNNKISL